MLLPRLAQHVLKPWFQGKEYPIVGSGDNMTFLGQLISGCVGTTVLPMISILVLRKQRAHRLGLLDQSSKNPSSIQLTETGLTPPQASLSSAPNAFSSLSAASFAEPNSSLLRKKVFLPLNARPLNSPMYGASAYRSYY